MGTGVGEAMLIGAVTGAGTSAIAGGDPLKGALLGAAGGGIGSGIGGALGGQAATQAGTTAATQAGTAAATQAGTAATTPLTTGATTGFTGAGATGIPSPLGTAGGINPYSLTYVDPLVGTTAGADVAAIQAGQIATQNVPKVGLKDLFSTSDGGSDFKTRLGNYLVQNPTQVGMTAGTLGSSFASQAPRDEKDKKYRGVLSRFAYDPDRYTSNMASGGLADTMVAKRLMKGGHLGSYSDGGRLLKGPGDGMSDNIPAKIGSKQPARLADGEFVVPADVVSGIGNGSTDAGARKLYAMMDKVRKARTGSKKQGRQINPSKYMPA